jgi:hypothetical protein
LSLRFRSASRWHRIQAQSFRRQLPRSCAGRTRANRNKTPYDGDAYSVLLYCAKNFVILSQACRLPATLLQTGHCGNGTAEEIRHSRRRSRSVRLAGGRHKFLGLSRTALRNVRAQIANVSSKRLRRAAKQAEPLAPSSRARMAAHGPKWRFRNVCSHSWGKADVSPERSHCLCEYTA